MVVGVSEGFKKNLKCVVSVIVQLAGNKLTLAVGKSHPDEVVAPEGITFEVPTPTLINRVWYQQRSCWSNSSLHP